MNWAQIIIVCFFVLGFFINLYWDVEGREARQPSGYTGVLSTVILYAIMTFVYYKAGMFGN